VSEAEVLWAMDICGEIGHPYFGQPIAAHQIVRTEGEPGMREVRVTACGKRLTLGNHSRGWWSSPPGKLPLAAHAVHCMAGKR
jgi:hypothetical protein